MRRSMLYFRNTVFIYSILACVVILYLTVLFIKHINGIIFRIISIARYRLM